MKATKEQIEAVFRDIRPILEADGDTVELLDVKDGVVKVRFVENTCSGCALSGMAPFIRDMISSTLQKRPGGIEKVVLVDEFNKELEL